MPNPTTSNSFSDPFFWLRVFPQILGAGQSTDPIQQGIGAASLANTFATRAGYNVPYLGPAASAAGYGYGLSQLAKSDLSTKRKVGQGVVGAASAYAGYSNPYAAAAIAANALGQHLQRSGSPELRGTGRAVSSAALPATASAFTSSISGGQAQDAWRGQPGGGTGALILDLLGPIGTILRGVGGDAPRKAVNLLSLGSLGHKPTEGTQFRNTLSSVMDKLGTFKGVKSRPVEGRDYELSPEQFNAYRPEVRDAATLLGYWLASYTPYASARDGGYGIQAQNILLNRYGDAVLPLALGTWQRYGVSPEAIMKRFNGRDDLNAALARLTGGTLQRRPVATTPAYQQWRKSYGYSNSVPPGN